jgi:hypothetical protein
MGVPLVRYGPRALAALTAALGPTPTGEIDRLLPALVAAGHPGAKAAILAAIGGGRILEDSDAAPVAARMLGDRELAGPVGIWALRYRGDREALLLMQRAFRALAGRSLREAAGGPLPPDDGDPDDALDAALERIEREFPTPAGR